MIDADIENLSYAAELKHFDESYEAEMAAINELPPSQHAVLEEIGPKLEAVKRRYFELNEAHGGEVPEHDAELDDLLEDVREGFKRLTAKTDSGGPPLA